MLWERILVATLSLTIYASKPGITDPDELVDDRDEFDDSYGIHSEDGDLIGLLLTSSDPESPPRWQSFLQEGVNEDLGLTSSYSSAILLMKVGDRLFAIPFGYGYHSVSDTAVDQRFGLRTTLNAIDPSGIRSIDRKIFDRVHRQAREQASIASGMDVFGINKSRDLLRAVTGRPAEDAPGTQMTGKDRLTLRLDCSLRELPALLEGLLDLSEQEKYRENFAWIDQIKEIRPKEDKNRLNTELAHRISVEDLDRIWLVPPDIIDWAETGGFVYRQAKSAEVFPDLRWEDYFSDRRSPEEFTQKHLQQDRVWRLDADESREIGSYSLGRCIAAEIRYEGNLYVLSDRTWYEIDSDFAENVDRFVEELEPTEVELPAYDDDEEREYNRRVAEESGEYLCLMDRNNIRPAPGESFIEFCDLYSQDRHMIHVKRYGGSSTLAKLFSQGQVAATTLFSHREFQSRVREELPESHDNIPADQLDARDFEVAYVVVAKEGKEEVDLPFFARVDLRETVRALRPTGCEVTLTTVPNSVETS